MAQITFRSHPGYNTYIGVISTAPNCSPTREITATVPSAFAVKQNHMGQFKSMPKAHFGLFLGNIRGVLITVFDNNDSSAQLSQLRQWVKRKLI